MIIWIVCIVLGLVLGALAAEADCSGDWPFGAFLGFIVGGVAGFVVALFVGAVVYGGTSVVDRTVRLESLQDGSSVRGSFFLGSGVINEVSVFTWYEQPQLGSYRQARADADDSTVHYTDQAPRYVVHIEKYQDGSFWGTWGWRLDAGNEVYRTYDFYVPKGSVKSSYELDAK